VPERPSHRVAVVGASGFAGALAAHLVHRHPQLELTAVTARADAGRRLDHLYPRYRVGMELEVFDADRVAERADAAIVGDDAIDDRVAMVLADEARRWKADLIVLGTHGRRGINHLLMGSVAEAVARVAPAHVLLVRARAARG